VHFALRVLQLWHLTSLDAATVAVVWTLAFARAARVSLPLWVPVIFVFGTWTMYVGDRVLDARSAKTPLRARHLFHWKHRHIFIPAAICASLAVIALIWFAVVHHQMPVAAPERNSILVAAALVYLGSVHTPRRGFMLKLRLPKELLVGVLFTLACAAPTWERVVGHRAELVAPVGAFILLAWLNCHAIERWESPVSPRVSVSAFSTILAVSSLFAAAAFRSPRVALLFVAAALSAGLLAWLDRNPHRFSPTTLRALADLVLLTPLVIIFLP